MAESKDFSDFNGDVSLEDFIKVFRAHGVEVDNVVVEGQDTEMIQIKRGDLIQVFDADPILYRGKAHRLARLFEVPIPELYKANQYKSAS